MKPNFRIFVKNDKPSSDEHTIINEISRMLTERLHEFHALKKLEIDLHINLFFSRPSVPDTFTQLSNSLYCYDATSLVNIDWTSFLTSAKGSLKKISTNKLENNLCLVFSLTPISENEIFAINAETQQASVSYKAVEPRYALEDVIMNESERKALLRSLAIITERELIFERWGFGKKDHSTKSVLCFHGDPGTGKTMCAHAVAKHLGKKILIGSYSSIQSKFVGEGEKNLVAYFKAAEEQDAVLFLDEADTFLSKRLPSSNENSKHYNSMSNELYQLIEDFNGCIVFASNHIRDFDPAVISRIIEPIEFKLPDKSARIQLIKNLLPDNVPLSLTEEQLEELSILTKGFSGRDLRKAVLLFIAESAYTHKVVNKESPESIVLSFDEIRSAFADVKYAKDNLKKGVSGYSIPSRVAEEAQKTKRVLSLAAHILWADGKISDKEDKLYRELSTQLGGDVDLHDKKSLMKIEDICNSATGREDAVQLLDVACRMAAVDGDYSQEENEVIKNTFSLLGFCNEKNNELDEYINSLVREYKAWEQITSYLEISEFKLFDELKKEYSEAASWYRLGKAYDEGSEVGGFELLVNETKAKRCLEKALNMGYKLDEKLYSKYFDIN